MGNGPRLAGLTPYRPLRPGVKRSEHPTARTGPYSGKGVFRLAGGKVAAAGGGGGPPPRGDRGLKTQPWNCDSTFSQMAWITKEWISCTRCSESCGTWNTKSAGV